MATTTLCTVADVLDKADEIFFKGGHKLSQTDEQLAFKEKLFKISRERRTKTIEECDDIDATAFVTEDEYIELLQEARSLKQ